MQESFGGPPDNSGLSALAARFIAWLVVAIGAVSMLGWWLQSPLLVRIASDLPPMSFLTAIGLVLAGASLTFATNTGTRLMPAILGMVAALFGVAALTQYLLNVDLGLDRTLDTGWLQDERPRLGRVAPATALVLLFGGSASALLRLLSPGRVVLLVPLLALSVGGIGLLTLLAHLLGLDLLLSWFPLTHMAASSALAAMLLGIALWLRWYSNAPLAAPLREHSNRRILLTTTTALAVITVVGGLISFSILERTTEDNLRRWLALSLQNRIEVYLETLRNAVGAETTIVTRPGIRRELIRLRTNSTDTEARAFLRQALGSFIELGFSGVLLQDTRGREIVRTGHFTANPLLRAPVNMAPGAELIWSDGPILYVRHAITDANGTLGVLTTEQPLPLLGRLLDNISGLGASAEMAVCAKSSGAVRCFPTRLRRHAFSLPERTHGYTMPIAAALDGITGVAAGPFETDGARAIVAYGPIPLTRLGMTLSISADELYQPMILRFQNTLWVLGVLLLTAPLLLWRQLQPMSRALAQSEGQAHDTLARLRIRQSMLKAILDGTSDAIHLKDREGRYVMISAAGARRIGRAPEEVIGRDDAALWEPMMARELQESDREVMTSGVARTVEETVSLHGGTRTWLVTKAPYLDDQGAPIGLIGIARDITERKQAEELVRALTLTDDLTGLRNRRGFVALAEAELGALRHTRRTAYLFYLDINNMKHINDRHGRAEGDRALCDVAGILRRSFREADIIGRLGGDEFAVLTTGDAADLPDLPLTRLRQHLNEHNRGGRRPYELSLNIGAVCYDPLAHADFETLLQEGNAAVYRATKDRRATQ